MSAAPSNLRPNVWRARFVNRRVFLILAAIFAFILVAGWPALKASWNHGAGVTTQDHIAWRTSYAAALAESSKTGKPVLLDFSATWCPPCQMMKQEVWPDPRVGDAVTAGYIPVFLDADSQEAIAPAQRYAVDTIPRILVVNASGDILRDGSTMSADEMLAFLKPPLKSS